MSPWLSIIDQLASPQDQNIPCAASGGASEIYGMTESLILKAVDGMLYFRVPDVEKMTGLNRVRINRTLVKLEKKGALNVTKCRDPFGRSVSSIWRPA